MAIQCFDLFIVSKINILSNVFDWWMARTLDFAADVPRIVKSITMENTNVLIYIPIFTDYDITLYLGIRYNNI